MLDLFARHRRLSKILLVEAVGLGHGFDEKLMRTRGEFARMIQGYLDRAVAAGVITPQDTVTISWAWFGAINEIVVRWLVINEPAQLQEALPTLRVILLRSIGAPVPAEPARASESYNERVTSTVDHRLCGQRSAPTVRQARRNRLPQRGAGL